MNTATGIFSALRRLGIVIAIAIVFLFGLATTVYLSLRSPEVKVPDVVGKDRFEAERVLGGAGLNYRVRATRPSNQLKADTVLFQVPRAGEVVKAGQTVAMDISRTAKEGEASEAVIEKPAVETTKPANANEAAAGNENKPKRNKNTNKNANDNSNANGNRNTNNNRAPNRNANAGNVNAGTNLNSNRPALIINNNANRGNENRRPPLAKPSPTKPKPEIP
ncbi:MAG: PASTA domain-containing protein [bacterium]